MASVNRVILVGNMTRDVELRYIGSGTAVCEIGLAVNERRKSASGEWVEDVQFIDVTLWSRTAEVASEYLGKGSPVLIEGRLKLDQWEKDGQKFRKLKVIAERMQMLGTKGDGSRRQNSPRKQGAAPYGDREYADPYTEPDRPDESEPKPKPEPTDDDIPW